MTSIENKRIVITGATSGIGRQTALRLASLGANVVLACRDRVRGESVAEEIGAPGSTEHAVMVVDTSDARSIRAFASEYRDTYGALDVLVNNAGVLLPARQTNVDGVELTFATNVLGYYLMTVELLDALGSGGPSRVVNVASTFAFGVDLDDPQFERRPYDGMTAYAQSKAFDRMLTWAFARRLPAEDVTFNAVWPGLVLETDLYRHLSPEAKRDLEQYESTTLVEATEAVVRMASSPELDGVSGRFFEQRAEVPCSFRDEETEERLWQLCEQMVGQLEPNL